MNKEAAVLSVVVPCFNEEQALQNTADSLQSLLSELIDQKDISPKSAIYFVDDGSTDKTWQLISELHNKSTVFCGVKLSRNRGHQNALLAGLQNVPGDLLVSIDADLQDDPQVIKKMLARYQQGADIVYGVRSDRTSDSFLKKFTAQFFYRFMHYLGVDMVSNHADFRLMSRRSVEALQLFDESNLFLRGIIPQIGYRTEKVYYSRSKRLQGESKYPFSKMLALALNGITSFSVRPLRFIAFLGFLICGISMVLVIWSLFVKLFTHEALPGWTSTVTPLYFLGGIQLLSLGIIGEYLGKIYIETKRRPLYIIETTLSGPLEISKK